jgi:hypothetical protein
MEIIFSIVISLLSVALFAFIVFFLARRITSLSRIVAARLFQYQLPKTANYLVATMGTFFLLIFLPMKVWNYWEIHTYREMIPSQFELSETVYHDEQLAGLIEGCGVAIFRLSDKTLVRIRHEGLAYLESTRLGREGDSYPHYQPWKVTPAVGNENLFRGAHCAHKPPATLQQAQLFVRHKEGSFFTTGYEKDLVIIPSLGVLIFSYNG